MNCIVYCRKSMEDDNRQILSIDSQESEMKKLALRDGLTINKVYQESMTAKAPGRPIFAEMMSFIEKQKDCVLLVWKLDRLARNPVDEGRIKWLLQQGVITKIKTPDRDYNPSDNVLITSVEFGMANQYIRDLRQNVMRGNRAKLEKGGWPNMAPFGYSNNRLEKNVLVNPDTSPAVLKIFELYATGKYNLKEVEGLIYSQGFRTKGGKKLSKSNIHKILQNPFYYGLMVKDGVHYPGKHTPLISKFIFDQANGVLTGKNKSKRQKHFYPLRGCMTCDVCGCLLTASLQKKKHLYYYCTNGKGICSERNHHLKADQAHELVSSVLQNLLVDEGLLSLAARAKEQEYGNTKKDTRSMQELLSRRLAAVQEQQDTLARRKDTPEDVYARNMATLKNEQTDLEIELSKEGMNPGQPEITFEQVKEVFLCANSMANLFLTVEPELKREYVETLLSNVWVKDNKAQHFQFKMPYQRIADIPKNPSLEQLCAVQDSNL